MKDTLIDALDDLIRQLHTEEMNHAQGDDGEDIRLRRKEWERKKLVPLLKRYGYRNNPR